MTRAENWKLVLQMCREAEDDVIDSVRIELLNDFGKVEAFSRGPNMRYLASCLRSFLPKSTSPILPDAVPNKALIFCLGASGSNVLNLLPVAQEARRRDLLGGIVAGEAVQRVNPGVFNEFSPVVHEQSLNRQVGMRFFWGSFQRAIRRLKWIIEWLGKRNRHCALRVRQNYGAYLKMMIHSERSRIIWQKLLTKWQPSCILSTSDFYPFEFQMMQQARKMGIPTSILQHGEINDVVGWPMYADTFLTWGESYREQFVNSGAPEAQVRVTGMPAADALINRAATSDIKPKTKPICLILSHTQDRMEDPALFEKFGLCVANTVRSMPEITWQIKLHPSENDSFYSETGISKLVEILPKSISLEHAVDHSDVVSTIRSTAGLQAMMLRKPLIVLDLTTGGPPVMWPSQGGGIYARSDEEFRTAINRLVSNNDFVNSLLEKQCGFLDRKFANRGKAASAIMDFLEETSARRTSRTLNKKVRSESAKT